jgi:N-acetyl-gamma-glutamyl-phosphate reductase
MAVSLFIDGAVGTTGLEIHDRIAGRHDIVPIILDDTDRKDSVRRAQALRDADVAILCLPDDAAREAVALAADSAVRIIDASSAHRTAPDWTYGFAEIDGGQGTRIASASRVSNPGCYATGFLALIAPLVQRGLIPADLPLTCNAVSGYSGGGKAMIGRFEAETDIAWRGYALGLSHKHVPEMQVHSGLLVPPLFTPSVIPAHRGMIVNVPLHHAAHAGIAEGKALYAALAEHYAAAPLVRVGDMANDGEILLRQGASPDDRVQLAVYASPDGSQINLVAMLDNLGKGASGACVHNLNLMVGANPLLGLRLG